MKKRIITFLLIITLAIVLGSCVTVHVHVPYDAPAAPADSLQTEIYWY